MSVWNVEMICETILNYLQQGVETEINRGNIVAARALQTHGKKKQEKKAENNNNFCKVLQFTPVENVSFAKVKKHNLAYITAVGQCAV